MQRNLAIPNGHDIRKKVRGSKRKLLSLEHGIDSIVLSIPNESLPHDKKWRYQLPSPDKLVDSTNSSHKLRKRFLQLLGDKLIELDRNIGNKYCALLFLSLPFLSHCRIEICVDKKHFERLINNADAPSTWSAIIGRRSIIKELNLALPSEYQAKGYFRTAPDFNNRQEECWFIWKTR